MSILRGIPAICRVLNDGRDDEKMVRQTRHLVDRDPLFPARKAGGIWVSTTDLVADYRRSLMIGTVHSQDETQT